MSKMIRVKRGLEARRIEYIPKLGELVWTTDNHELWIGDNVTTGGIKVTGVIETMFIPKNEKGIAGGVASLDGSGQIPASQIPLIAISQTWVVGSQNEQLALPAQIGDVAVRTDLNKTFIHGGGTTGTMADWIQMAIPGESVRSVNGQTGVIVLSLDDIDGVNLQNIQINDLLQYNGNEWVPVNPDTIGRKTFSSLDDTPTGYAQGTDKNLVEVDEANQRLVFTDTIDGGLYVGSGSGNLSDTSRVARRTSTLQKPVDPSYTKDVNEAIANIPKSETKQTETKIRKPKPARSSNLRKRL